MIRKLLFVPAWCITLLIHAQDRERAFEINEELGRGINIGNTFEAPAEGEWGSLWKASYFKTIAELGFRHVRVPIRWETAERSMASPPYTITPAFLDRIQEVIDSARRYKLYIIINMHHHDALFADPAGQRDRFLSQWYQIANRFKDYPDSLLFEVLNEPHGNLVPALWNEYFSDALAEIRKTNPTRIVLMGTAEYGGLAGVPHLDLPPDDNIILSIHYYNPFSFTHQGAEWVEDSDPWLGTEWLDTEADRQAVESEFTYALQFSEDNDIPIHIGEFGAYSKADMPSRERWTTFLARWFEAKNLSWAYWEFNSGFGIYDPMTNQLITPLADALLHNELPEATPIYATPVYSSNFSTGVDGWALFEQGGADGTLSVENNSLLVTVATSGTEAWHLQLVRNNISLEKNKLYRVSFTAEASTTRGITAYAGKATSPWNSYSGYTGLGITTSGATYSYTFTMADVTDPAARLVFDLGVGTGQVKIGNIAVEEITFTSPEPEPITSVWDRDGERSVSVYPNPVSSWLRVESPEQFAKATIFDVSGRPLVHLNMPHGRTDLDVSLLPPGIYVLVLMQKDRVKNIKLIKK